MDVANNGSDDRQITLSKKTKPNYDPLETKHPTGSLDKRRKSEPSKFKPGMVAPTDKSIADLVPSSPYQLLNTTCQAFYAVLHHDDKSLSTTSITMTIPPKQFESRSWSYRKFVFKSY